MFYKNFNLFGMLTFDSAHYKKVIETIKASKAYISFIDSENNIGIVNPRYERYVMLKQAAYTREVPKKFKSKEKGLRIYSLITSPEIGIDKTHDFIEKHGIHDDFTYRYEIEEKSEEHYVATHVVHPIEYSVFNTALELDENFEQINWQYLREDFLLKNFQRFILLPFLGKYDGEYVKPIVIANIYDVGLITLQISVGVSDDKPKLTKDEPNHILLNEVQFYELKENYTSKDFWKREKVEKATMYDVLDYYSKQLINICKNYNLIKETDSQLAWVFGDFEINKRADHKSFVDKNTSFYISHLLNAPKSLMDKMSGDNLKEILEKSTIQKYKSMHFYCSEVIAVLSFSYSAFHAEAVSSIEEYKDELKKDGIYEEVLKEIYKEQTIFTMFEFLRLYELTFIKKYYALKLLKKLSNNNFKTLKDYNSAKREFNQLKINYDEQLLFKNYGSPMHMYSQLLVKSGTEKIVKKVENLFSDAREDVLNAREFTIKQSDTYILIMTSILTVLFGFRAIKFIIEDILINLPYVGTFFAQHPLRHTVILWLILLGSMIALNIYRYISIKS